MVVVHFCLHIKHYTLAAVGGSQTGIDKPLIWLIPACGLYFPFVQVSPVALTLSWAALLHWGLLEAKCVAPCLPRIISWRNRNYDRLGSGEASCKRERVPAQALCLWKHMFSLCIHFIDEFDFSSESVINFSFFLSLNSMAMCSICWSQVGRLGVQSWNLLRLRLL